MDTSLFYKMSRFYVILCLTFCLTNSVAIFGENFDNESINHTFDVIIVLGTPATEDCLPTEIMKQRVGRGVELFKQGLSSRLILTGGAAANSCIESSVMREYAMSLGVPDSCIFIEGQSQNTYQNAYYSIQIMNSNNLHSAAIVTSKFHAKRSGRIFSNYNIQYELYPCDNPPKSIKCLLWKLREFVILSYHQIFGYSPSFGL